MEFLTPQLSCPNETLILKCQFTFFPPFVVWTSKTFGNFKLTANDSMAKTITSGNGRFLANLRVNTQTSNGAKVSSTLTILPPLNNVSKITLNNTIVRCFGGNESVDALIMLNGEKPRIYTIIDSCIKF